MSVRPMLFAGLAFLIASPEIGRSAEIKVLSANVFTGVLDGQFRDFERISGHKVTFDYGTAGNIRGRVESGEPGDVVIVTRPMMDALEKDGNVVRGSTRDMARSAVALVVRRGAPKPDVGSVEAFKQALLAARSISYPDPTRGGATGVLVTAILKRLGMAAEITGKAIYPPPGGFAVDLVAHGDAEVAIAQPMEALLQPDVEIAGLLPSALQDPPSFTFSIGQMAIAKEPDAARAIIQYMVGSTVRSALKSKGMEPAAAP
jgi:molybdate transport system substrate-binding protein